MFSLSACLSDAVFSKSLGDGFSFSTPASQKVNIVNVNVRFAACQACCMRFFAFF